MTKNRDKIVIRNIKKMYVIFATSPTPSRGEPNP